ncbi:hypothetical protein T492DRAFT_1127445 [Pavlovales sp. CCMP2436]|nr:hypothetical protein T492DRAFT_1127445 [Pavlovales sp. CCMP2436]
MAEAGTAADETGNGVVSKSGCQPKSGGESGGQSGADDAVKAEAAESGSQSQPGSEFGAGGFASVAESGSQSLQPMQAGAVQAVTAALWPGGHQPDRVRYLVLARVALGATVRVQSPGGGLNGLSDSDGVSGSDLNRNSPIYGPRVGRRALARVPLEAASRTLGLSSPPQQPPSDVARTTSAQPADVAAGMQAMAGGRQIVLYRPEIAYAEYLQYRQFCK